MKKDTVRVAVFVSGGGTNLQALLDSEGSVLKHAKITLVLASNEKAYALERAKQADVETLVVRKKDFPTVEAYEQEMIAELEARNIDLIVLAGFMTILSENFVKHYDHRIINVHPSLIPAFCGKDFYGLRVHEAALEKGVKVTGATVHFVNEIPDGGDILLQKAVKIKEGDTPEVLQRRVMEKAEWKLLPKAVEMVAKDILKHRRNDAN